MVGTIYKIKRLHPILQFSWKLEKLGFIKICENREAQLSLQVLVSDRLLEDLKILKVTETGQIKLITRGNALNRLLNKLVTEQVNEGVELSETIKQLKQ